MSGIPPNAIVRSPREATNVFGSQPKQRNLFVVRFYPNGSPAGGPTAAPIASLTAPPQTSPTGALLTPLTFIVKSTERPKINTKVEELHQYNKKRQVFTGFKLEPVRIQFYDDAHSSALAMWQSYVQYYFGDFTGVLTTNSSKRPYAYDVINAQMQSMNFGFTAAAANGLGDFYFDHIEIYHFYNQVYDVWQLINPRITQFDPDELDYSNSDASLISMSVVYENLQFALNQDVKSDVNGAPFSEFVSDSEGGQSGTFNGDVIPLSQMGQRPTQMPASLPDSSSTSIESLMASAQGSVSGTTTDYRYISTPSTGPLGQYGDYQYGPSVPQSLTTLAATNTAFASQLALATTNPSLSALALTNPALAAALDMGANTDPLSLTQGSLQAVSNTLARRGINGAQLDIVLAQAVAATRGQSNTAANILTKAILAANAIQNAAGFGGNGMTFTSDGLTMSPQGYGAINVQQTGTAQYGFNGNATASGTTSGYTGADGYQGPVGQVDDGPYDSNLPNGLYGRYGITVEPLGPIGIPDDPVAAAS